MATITTTTTTATRQTNQELHIQMQPYRPQQYPQPGQPFFSSPSRPSVHIQVPASLIPGARPSHPRPHLKRNTIPIQTLSPPSSSPILPKIHKIKMRPEYLPPLVIPLPKSSSAIKIRQIQQEQRVLCPVYRPKPVHPPPPVPSHAPPAPPADQIYELPGDFNFPSSSTPKHPDSALALDSSSSTTLPKLPLTESPKPITTTILDKETITTLQAYYRSSSQQQQSHAPWSKPAAATSNTKLRRSTAIYVRNPHAQTPSPTTKSSSGRKTFLLPKHWPIMTTNPESEEPRQAAKVSSSIERVGTRSDTYSSVLEEWEQEMADRQVDIREQYQPSQQLVNEFGQREQEALQELMGFLDEMLGITSDLHASDEGIAGIDESQDKGKQSSPIWWRHVRKSLL
ncbi:hypothetical protein QBC44DRAFT_335783 [Cladorrhinum sp. PSN332]|nr:hypothetical protein QBC44DRAFT_335783 [Cladorrhinum sp. PSN332]